MPHSANLKEKIRNSPNFNSGLKFAMLMDMEFREGHLLDRNGHKEKRISFSQYHFQILNCTADSRLQDFNLRFTFEVSDPGFVTDFSNVNFVYFQTNGFYPWFAVVQAQLGTTGLMTLCCIRLSLKKKDKLVNYVIYLPLPSTHQEMGFPPHTVAGVLA
ncbi:hypothetical protein KI387_026392, partial [Taxus chinensis]